MKLYETTEFIEFSQTDPAGILFFSRSFEIYHRSLEKWVSNKMGWDRFFTNPDFAFPIVHSESNYFSPCFAGNSVQVELKLESIGERSFSLSSTIKKDEKDLFEVKTKHVCLDKKSHKSTSVPTFIKEALNQ